MTFERPRAPAIGRTTLTVPPNQPRCRTWAFTRRIRAAGDWTVRVRTAAGAEVVAKQFTVEPGTAVRPATAEQPQAIPSAA